MSRTRTKKFSHFFKRVLLAVAAPVWAADLPFESDFPTRTIEIKEIETRATERAREEQIP